MTKINHGYIIFLRASGQHDISHQVPSAYYLCDCFLELDRRLGEKLFRPPPGKTRSSLAADEAVRAKRCIQGLRYLWRSSRNGSHTPQVQELKECLQESPLQKSHRGEEPASDPEDDDDDVPASGGSSDDEAEVDGVEGGLDGEPVEENAQPLEDGPSQDSLTAPTLRLPGYHGEGSPGSAGDGEDGGSGGEDGGSGGEESDAPLPDSQFRPEGWMGGFYHKWKHCGYDVDHINKMNAVKVVPPSPKKDAEVSLKLIMDDVETALIAAHLGE